MIKSLRVTILQCEDLPSPLAIRMHAAGSRVRQVAVQKAFETCSEAHVTLKLYCAGELIGLLPLLLSATQSESKWLPVSISPEEIRWSDIIGEVSQGPRIHVCIDPLRALSPILELTETRECSFLDSSLEDSSLLSTLQKERENHSATLREMQVKMMEMQQELVKVKWQSRMELEQVAMKCKSELSVMSAALEKAKSVLKKESANTDLLNGKLKAAEEKLREAAETGRLRQELHSKSSEVADLTRRLAAAEAANGLLESRLRDSEAKLVDSKLRTYDTPKKSTAPSEKASEQSQDRPTDCIISDLVDDLLQDYIQTQKVTIPIVRLAEGVYVVGKKQVEMKVCRGLIAVKDRGKQMSLEQFLRLHDLKKQSSAKLTRPRPKSVEPEAQRHFRSMSNFIDLIARPYESSIDTSVRMHTDHSLDRASDFSRGLALPFRADGRPDYRKSTISSGNKRREKRASISERSRILRL